MDLSKTWARGARSRAAWASLAVCGAVLLPPRPGQAGEVGVEAARPRVGVVTARTATFNGHSQEEKGNCLLWTVGERLFTLGDLHTVMAGEEGPSNQVADQIVVTVGRQSSRARLVWPPEGQRNVLDLDMGVLELENGIVSEPYRPEDFEGAADRLPRDLYLAAPGHRARILAISAPSVGNRSQWFLYHELAHGDSGGMVFVLDKGRVVPQGFVSAIGSLPGESARGTLLYGRDAMRIFIGQFVRARTAAARLGTPVR